MVTASTASQGVPQQRSGQQQQQQGQALEVAAGPAHSAATGNGLPGQQTSASNAVPPQQTSEQGSAIEPARSLQEEESAFSAAEEVAGPSHARSGARRAGFHALRPTTSMISTAVQRPGSPYHPHDQHAQSPKVYRTHSVVSQTPAARQQAEPAAHRATITPRGGTPGSVYGQMNLPAMQQAVSRQRSLASGAGQVDTDEEGPLSKGKHGLQQQQPPLQRNWAHGQQQQQQLPPLPFMQQEAATSQNAVMYPNTMPAGMPHATPSSLGSRPAVPLHLQHAGMAFAAVPGLLLHHPPGSPAMDANAAAAVAAGGVTANDVGGPSGHAPSMAQAWQALQHLGQLGLIQQLVAGQSAAPLVPPATLPGSDMAQAAGSAAAMGPSMGLLLSGMVQHHHHHPAMPAQQQQDNDARPGHVHNSPVAALQLLAHVGLPGLAPVPNHMPQLALPHVPDHSVVGSAVGPAPAAATLAAAQVAGTSDAVPMAVGLASPALSLVCPAEATAEGLAGPAGAVLPQPSDHNHAQHDAQARAHQAASGSAAAAGADQRHEYSQGRAHMSRQLPLHMHHGHGTSRGPGPVRDGAGQQLGAATVSMLSAHHEGGEHHHVGHAATQPGYPQHAAVLVSAAPAVSVVGDHATAAAAPCVAASSHHAAHVAPMVAGTSTTRALQARPAGASMQLSDSCVTQQQGTSLHASALQATGRQAGIPPTPAAEADGDNDACDDNEGVLATSADHHPHAVDSIPRNHHHHHHHTPRGGRHGAASSTVSGRGGVAAQQGRPGTAENGGLPVASHHAGGQDMMVEEEGEVAGEEGVGMQAEGCLDASSPRPQHAAPSSSRPGRSGEHQHHHRHHHHVHLDHAASVNALHYPAAAAVAAAGSMITASAQLAAAAGAITGAQDAILGAAMHHAMGEAAHTGALDVVNQPGPSTHGYWDDNGLLHGRLEQQGSGRQAEQQQAVDMLAEQQQQQADAGEEQGHAEQAGERSGGEGEGEVPPRPHADYPYTCDPAASVHAMVTTNEPAGAEVAMGMSEHWPTAQPHSWGADAPAVAQCSGQQAVLLHSQGAALGTLHDAAAHAMTGARHPQSMQAGPASSHGTRDSSPPPGYPNNLAAGEVASMAEGAHHPHGAHEPQAWRQQTAASSRLNAGQGGDAGGRANSPQPQHAQLVVQPSEAGGSRQGSPPPWPGHMQHDHLHGHGHMQQHPVGSRGMSIDGGLAGAGGNRGPDSSLAMATAGPSTRSATISGGGAPSHSNTVELSWRADSQMAEASSSSADDAASDGAEAGVVQMSGQRAYSVELASRSHVEAAGLEGTGAAHNALLAEAAQLLGGQEGQAASNMAVEDEGAGPQHALDVGSPMIAGSVAGGSMLLAGPDTPTAAEPIPIPGLLPGAGTASHALALPSSWQAAAAAMSTMSNTLSMHRAGPAAHTSRQLPSTQHEQAVEHRGAQQQQSQAHGGPMLEAGTGGAATGPSAAAGGQASNPVAGHSMQQQQQQQHHAAHYHADPSMNNNVRHHHMLLMAPGMAVSANGNHHADMDHQQEGSKVSGSRHQEANQLQEQLNSNGPAGDGLAVGHAGAQLAFADAPSLDTTASRPQDADVQGDSLRADGADGGAAGWAGSQQAHDDEPAVGSDARQPRHSAGDQEVSWKARNSVGSIGEVGSQQLLQPVQQAAQLAALGSLANGSAGNVNGMLMPGEADEPQHAYATVGPAEAVILHDGHAWGMADSTGGGGGAVSHRSSIACGSGRSMSNSQRPNKRRRG